MQNHERLRWGVMWGVAGAVLAFGTVQVMDAVRYVRQLPLDGLAATVPLPMTEERNPPVSSQTGTPRYRGAHYTDGPGKASGSGVWACDGPSTFEWNFGADEVVYLIEGEVQVSYLGKQFTIRAGETSLFLQGTSAVWTVPNGLLKSYTLHYPPTLVRWWRKWSA